MTTVFRSGFEALVLGVKAYLTAAGVTAYVGCGYRELTKSNNQGVGRANRIVFLPADEGGNAGKMVPVRGPGTRLLCDPDDASIVVGEVRSLGDWDRTITVSIWAHDPDHARDELAQQVAAEELLEWTQRAVSFVGLATIAWSAVRVVLPMENVLGTELRVGLTFSSPIYDVPLEVATPGFRLTKE